MSSNEWHSGTRATLISLDVKGTENLEALLASVSRADFMQAVAMAVYAEANIIMLASKEIVPVDDGPLRASGTVEMPIVDGYHWYIRLGYGGAAEAYALIQHENLLFRHKDGRTAKYLEIPVMDHLPIMEGRMGMRVEKYLTEHMKGAL